MEYIILFSVGLISGILGSLVGLGGGIIIVPSLLFLSAYTDLVSYITPQIAVGTSLLVMIFTGLSSTLMYMKHKTVDYQSGLIFFLGSGPGAIVGAIVNKYLNVETFNLYFGIFIICISFVLMIKGKVKPLTTQTQKKLMINRTKVDLKGNEYTYGFNPLVAVAITFIVGFLAGIFGIGGGALMVPAMILLFRFPPHIAIATSMFIIFLSSTVSSATHFTLGHISWGIAIVLIPGAWIGARLGAMMNQRIKSETLVVILRIMLLIIAIRLIF